MWDFKWKDDSFFLVVHLPSASASELPRAWQKSLEAFCRGRNSTKSLRKYCSSGGRRHDTINGSSSTDLILAPDARSSVGATCFELFNPSSQPLFHAYFTSVTRCPNLCAFTLQQSTEERQTTIMCTGGAAACHFRKFLSSTSRSTSSQSIFRKLPHTSEPYQLFPTERRLEGERSQHHTASCIGPGLLAILSGCILDAAHDDKGVS